MFGKGSPAFARFSDGRKADNFKRIFDALANEADIENAVVVATIVKVHGHGPDAKGDATPSHRPVEGRHDDQDFRPH